MEHCPKCQKEILPYLKTGELKKIEFGNLISYQLYFCISCKIVYWQEHERFKLLSLEEERAKNIRKASETVKGKVRK